MRRLSILLPLLCASLNAWGLSFNPGSPSTSGAYTVLWGQPLGCDGTNNPYYDCYDLRESTDGGQSWNTVVSSAYQGLTSWSTSGKTAGTYDYAVFYYMGAFPGSYDYPAEAGTMVVQSQAVNFTITNATGTEGGSVIFTVTKNGTTSQTTGVSWTTTTAGTATSGSDYAAASGSLSFAASDVTKTFTVNTLQDSTAEYPESFGVQLVSATGPGASLGYPWTTAGGTINDDDPVPTVSIGDASVAESGDLVFTATLSHPAVYVVTVNVAVTDGSTTVNSDYHPYEFSRFSFNPFETSTQFVLHTLNDTVYEGNETLTVTISPSSGGSPPIGDGSALGTIMDAADAPQFTINDASVSEGGTLAFTVTQTGASVFTHVVSYATGNGSATLADGDYTAASGTLSFPPTASSTQSLGISVGTIDESPIKQEAAETVVVNLGDGGLNGAAIIDAQGAGTITNDDAVSFTISDTSVAEGGNLSFTITRNGASDFTHAVSYATADGSAYLSQNDYVPASGSVSFPPSTSGAPTQSVSITTVDESPARVENSETVLLNLANGGQLNGATIGDAQGIGTITNDDSVSFTINDVASTEGVVVGFTVTMNGLTDLSHSVQWSTADGTATVASSDYSAVGLTTINFSSSQTTQSVNVSSTSDSVSEPNETFTVNLSNPGAWSTIADSSGVGTINNNDAPGAPSSLSAPIGFAGSSVALTWTAGSGYLTYYEVEETFNNGAPTVINTGGTSASYTAGSLTTDGLYQFRVRACTSAGGTYCSAWSAARQTVRSNVDTTTGVPVTSGGSGDAGPSTGLTTDFNGIVAGTASVVPSGASTYTIPIKIPPGTRGMEPALALTYMSHSGEGVVGRGWAVTGASSVVTRCGTTLAQDGAIHAVDYTSADRFCLDGQRLVRTSSTGAYGGDGTKYRTELESFRDVVSNGGTPSSPNSFTVRTPDGRTLYYGGTATTNFNANAPNSAQVAAWLLRRVEDKYGNFYDVTYNEDEANGFFDTQRIDYTGHSTTPVTSTYASVEFQYDAVANPIKRYNAGSATSLRQRLAKIVVKNAGAAVREYVLAYNGGDDNTPPPSGMSRLTSVMECAPTQASGVCTAPTTFDWINEIGGMDTAQVINISPLGHEEWVDLNGDGRTDAVQFGGGTAQQTVWLANGAGGFASSVSWTAQSIPGNAEYVFADIDGDGDADFVVFGKPGTVNAPHQVYKSNGTGYQTLESWIAADTQSGRAFADFNGDGRADFITWNNDVAEPIPYTVNFSVGNGYTTQTWTGPKLSGGGWWPDSWDFHDVNGDGRADLVLVKGTTHRIYINNPSSPGFGGAPIEATTTIYAGAGGTWADVNGDGLLDYVQTYDLYDHPIALWTGKTYVNEVWHGPRWSDPPLMRDLNGDGLADYNGSDGVGFSTGMYASGSTPATGFVAPPPWNGFSGYGSGNGVFPDIDGDGKPDFKAGQAYQINKSQPVHLMEKVTDGLGMETRFEYKPLTDNTVHTKSTGSVYPISDMVNAVHVVSKMRQSDGVGDFFDTVYKYEGFKVDKSGRGSLGFYKVTAEDLDRKIKTVTTYAQTDGANYANTYALTGLPITVDVTVTDKLDNGTNLPQPIAESDRTYVVRAGVTSYDGGPAIMYVCVDTDIRVDSDVESGLPLRTTLTDNDPGNTGVPCDSYGNPGQAGTADGNGTPLNRRVTVTDQVPNPDVVYRTDTVTYFKSDTTANNETDWLLNMPTRQVARPLVDGVGDATKDRTTAITYVSGKGTVDTIVREPDQSAPIKLTNMFGYDNFGNRMTETITPSDTVAPPSVPLARTQTVTFDSVGRFPDLLTNALGQVTDLNVDARFGTLLEADGPNATSGAFNDKITRTYDVFGRMKDERQPDGSYEVVYFKAVGASASGIADRTTAKIMVETSVQDTAWGTTPTTRLTPVRTFLDGYGRELRKRTRAFDSSSFVHVDTYYDSRGRGQKTSEPYLEGQTPQWNMPAYDVLGRPLGVTAADSSQSTSTDYDAFTVTTTDAGGRSNRLISDALGRVTRVENLDASSVVQAVTEYLYDKAGNATTVQKRTPGNTVIANTAVVSTFDRLGRTLTTTDPDLGAGANGRVDFVYDSLGDLRRQQTPRLRAQSATLFTEFDYDKLGRMTTRRDPSTSLTQTVISTFTFDQVTPAGCEAGKGHLTGESISGGGEPGLTVAYCYSPAKLGRLDNEKRTTASVTYQTDFSYDVLGRVSQVKYPATATWPAASRYAVNYMYNPRGYLEQVKEAQGSLAVLYQTVGANARGQIEKAYLGDGSRTTRSYVKGTERLAFTNAAMGASQPVQNFVYAYDAIGNVTGRGDLLNSLSETFGYDALDRLTSSTVTNGTGPHAVTYQYDAAGNLGNLTHKSDTSTLPSASMSYSTTARPHAVTSLNTGSATRNFSYNANGSLTGGQVDSSARTLTWTSDELPAAVTIGTTSRTFSYGAERERYKQVWVSGANTRTYTYIGEHYVKEVQGSATEHKLYIYANGEQVAYVSDDGTPETRYLHKDHLGSVTTIVTNQNWSGREKLSYDAWGKRRSGTDWWSAASTASEERGYTGHEHLDDVSLIHMNGRLLDPKLGRVISADPTVPEPLYSQSYNRFSYVYNNPLKYTDPSGFAPHGDPDREPDDNVCRVLVRCGGGGLFEHFFSTPDYHENEFVFHDYEGYLSFLAQEAAFAEQAALMAVKGPADTPARTDQGGLSPVIVLVMTKPDMSNGFVVRLSENDRSPQGSWVFSPPTYSFFRDDLIGRVVSSGLGDPIAWVRGQFSGEYTNPLSKEALLMEEDRQNAAFQVAMAGMGALTRLTATAKTITEGIYEFVASSGKTYVGQSGNIPARLLRHIRSGKLVEGTAVKTKEVLGGKTVREIAEHRRIDKLGGIDKLENIRYPIGPNRQYLLQ